MKILLVEDDNTIASGLDFCLKKENFEVVIANKAQDAILKIKQEDFNLMLLDINLPDMDGLTMYQKIKEEKDIPTIFLTANDLETTVVQALDMGADDYITKPFKTRELISRINSVLRRVRPNEATNTITIADVTINLRDASVYKKQEKIFLTALEYKILLIMFQSPGRVFTREAILADIWDTSEEYVNDNTLTVYIKRIREKIEDNPTEPKIILTVRGLGYKASNEN
ncbi:MAG: response regulator transcription factor [Bacilli bacterium]|nr:response regulator transcription factor [Bacilli bacterium]